jgi:hypothetical protein
MCKGLQQEIFKNVRHGSCYKVCIPTQKSALSANATTIFDLFDMNPIDYTYLKSTVENLKKMVLNGIIIMEILILQTQKLMHFIFIFKLLMLRMKKTR